MKSSVSQNNLSEYKYMKIIEILLKSGKYSVIVEGIKKTFMKVVEKNIFSYLLGYKIAGVLGKKAHNLLRMSPSFIPEDYMSDFLIGVVDNAEETEIIRLVGILAKELPWRVVLFLAEKILSRQLAASQRIATNMLHHVCKNNEGFKHVISMVREKGVHTLQMRDIAIAALYLSSREDDKRMKILLMLVLEEKFLWNAVVEHGMLAPEIEKGLMHAEDEEIRKLMQKIARKKMSI